MKQIKAICFFCSPYNEIIHSKIEKELFNNEFTPNSAWGFRVFSRRNNYIRAAYIEKQVFKETITDPFDNISEFERVIYTQVEFQLNVSPPNILIFNPPKTSKKLLNQIASFTEYSIAIERKKVKVLDWVESITNQGLKCFVSKAIIDSIMYDNYTSGKLTLSGHKDIRPQIKSILKDTDYSIKNVKVDFNRSESFPNVELYENGKIVFAAPTDIENFLMFYDSFFLLPGKLIG